MNKILCLLFMLVIMGTAHAGERLSNDELKSYYTDMTITAFHFMRKEPEMFYFGSDGTAHKKIAGGEEVGGKWWIDEKSNMVCYIWDNKNTTFCLVTEQNNDGTYSQTTGRGKSLYEIKSRQQGNQL